MTIKFSTNARKDMADLRRENPKLAAKFLDLLLDIMEHPDFGIGEPEQLRGDKRGYWARRISPKHRLVYRVVDDVIEIASCHGHYGDK